jgi:LuxR family transcriptional regulator
LDDAPVEATATTARLIVLPANHVYTSLPRRQHAVLWLHAQGYTDHEIARAFGVRESTVRSHLRAAQRRLCGRTRLHALAIAFRHGLLF